MVTVRFVILGAGPTGLALAHALRDRGIPPDQVVVLEREAEPGGLCRSAPVDGAPLDIGGGHFLDIRRREVLEFLFRFMPEQEWVTHQRVAKIVLRGREIDHPLEANLWQLPRPDQVDYLDSIARAGSVRGDPMPGAFSDWMRWKLGDRIAEEYMLPYNRKIWSMDLDLLGTYWLHKLPDVSFRDTLRSCLEGRPFGSLPAHGTFLYPRAHGYGEVWKRMGEALGESLVLSCDVTRIDVARRVVNDRWRADVIVNTIPWPLWLGRADVPEDVAACMRRLVNVSIDIDYRRDRLPTNAHWTYEPREDVPFHRTLARHNFCEGARGHWTETNAARSGTPEGFRHRNEFAYPVNTHDKPQAIASILEWARAHRIAAAGRWGTWEHMNSDVAVASAIDLAGALVGSAEPGAP